MSDVPDSKPLSSLLTQSFMNNFNANIIGGTKSDKDVLLVADIPPAVNSINFINLDECSQLAGSRNTKRVTASSVRLFRAFLKETNNGRTDFENFNEEILINHLIIFFKRIRKPDGDLYTKNGLLSIRFGLRRRLLDLRKVDITKHPRLNSVFSAQINKLKREGKGDIHHYPAISYDDMFKIYSSGVLSPDTPKGLLRKVFFETEMFFCRRSRENLRDLKGSHFKIETDDQGNTYLTTDFDPLFGGGPIKRIHETGTDMCPVKAFQKFFLKRHSGCDALFQRPVDIIPFSEQDPWFYCSALGLNKLANMMREISSEACLSKIYTNHSIRATSKSVFDLVWNGLYSQNSPNTIAPVSSNIGNINDTTPVPGHKPQQTPQQKPSRGNKTGIDLKSSLDIQEIESKPVPVEEANCELFTSVNNVSNAFSLNSFNGTVQADKQAAEKDMVETVSGNTIEFKLRQSEYMEAQKQQAEFMEAQKQQAEFMEAQKQQAEFMEAQKQQAEKLAEERQQRQNETKVYKYMVLNHEKKILETLRTLWKGNQFCDAMLQNECVSIPVHKILLIACCPKILDTYDYIMKDTNVQVCFPRKVSADALRAFVDYLYSGSLNLSKSILDSMEYLSGMLGLDDICQLCNQFRLDLFNDSSNMPDKTIVNVSHSQNSSGIHLSLANRSTTPPPPIVRLSSHTALSASSTTNIRMSSSPHYQDNRRVSYSQKSSESRYSILPEQSAESDVLNVNSIKLEPEVDLTVDDCTEVKQEMATYQSSEDCQFGSWSQIDSQSDDSLSHRKKNNSTNFDIQTTVDLSVMPLKSFTTGHSQKASSHDDPDLQSVITISPSNSPLHSPTSVDSSPEVQTFEVDSETPNLKTHLNPYPVSLVMANTHNLSLPENNRKKKNSFDDFDVDFECKKSKISLH